MRSTDAVDWHAPSYQFLEPGRAAIVCHMEHLWIEE